MDNNSFENQFLASIQTQDTPTQQPKISTEKRKPFAVFIILAAIFAIATLILAMVFRGEKQDIEVFTGVTIIVAPTKASVEIDGKVYQNGTHSLNIGKHTAKISADGFESRELEFEIEETRLTTLTTYLKPTSGSYNDEDYDILRFVSDSEVASLIEPYIAEHGADYKFPSQKNAILPVDKLPSNITLSNYSKKLISSTISAYFYYGHPEIVDTMEIADVQNDRFTLNVSDKQRYLVSYKAENNEVSYVMIQKYGSDQSVFWSYGDYIYDDLPLDLPDDDSEIDYS